MKILLIGAGAWGTALAVSAACKGRDVTLWARSPALLQTLNADYGKTIIMVTHDPKAADYAKTQLHLDKGRLVEAAHA